MANYTVQGPDGAQHVIAGPDGASDQEVIAQAQKLFPGPSMLESAARGVENNFPLANQAIAAGSAALGDKSYSQNLEEQNAAIKSAKAANPVSYDAGAVAGAVAPLAIPGVGEALEGAPIAGNAALGAAQAVSNTDVTKQPGEALKQAATGAAIGGTLGKILPSGEGAAQELESYANKKGVQALNLRPGMLGIPEEELEDLGAKAHELGLVEGSTPERAAKAQDLLHRVGAQIQDIGGGAQPLTDASPFVNHLHDAIQESSSIYGPEANQELPIYRQGIANLSKPNLTFDELQTLKNAYGKRAFDDLGNVKNDAAADVYGQVKEAMKSIIEGSPSEYQEAMDNYSTLKDISGGITSQLAKEQASGVQAKGFGMVGKLAGMIEGNNPAVNAATAGALGASGHPMMAIGALTPVMSNPGALSSLARGASEGVTTAASAVKAGSLDAVTSKIMSALQTSPQSLGKFAQPLMQAAKSGGNQGIAATHFLLSQQYPEYNELMQKREENENQ